MALKQLVTIVKREVKKQPPSETYNDLGRGTIA